VPPRLSQRIFDSSRWRCLQSHIRNLLRAGCGHWGRCWSVRNCASSQLAHVSARNAPIWGHVNLPSTTVSTTIASQIGAARVVQSNKMGRLRIELGPALAMILLCAFSRTVWEHPRQFVMSRGSTAPHPLRLGHRACGYYAGAFRTGTLHLQVGRSQAVLDLPAPVSCHR
jgi:hypothetical protein